VTEPDATGSSAAAIGPRDATRHAEQVVRRVLLRRNIVIDAETAQLVAPPSRPVHRPGAGLPETKVFRRPVTGACNA